VETKANYVLIGLFAIAGFLGMLLFFLWLARVELDRQFAYYDVRFSSVSGLGNASDVRFSGLPVGQVVDVRLSPDRDGTIAVRLEVAADTPVRADSVATIEAQGVTGVSFVSISPGSPETPLLTEVSDVDIPEIEAGRSTLQSLTEDAPELVAETLRVVQQVGDLFRGENADRLERILINAETASADFSAALDGFSGMAGTVDQFAEQINRFNTTLDALTQDLSLVLSTANETLGGIGQVAADARGLVESGTGTLSAADGLIAEAQRYIAEDLSTTTAEAQDTLAALRTDIEALRADASALIETLQVTGTTATARLQEAEVTLERANALIASLDTTTVAVEAAATRFDGLLVDQATPLLTETRTAVTNATEAISTIRTAAETDLPAIMTDIRTAVENARTVIDTVGRDLTSATADVPALVASAETAVAQVTDTFANANETLTAMNDALETGQRTLVAAESAFTGADALINDDIAGLIAELETTVQGLNAAIDTVSEDLPAISAEVRAASTAASDAFTQLRGLVDASAPGLQSFAATGLPLYTRLAQETRALIANLDQLTRQIERGPTHFLLNRDLPEFRR
jgi:phospholipid/cholesterol/gamma-HCH transport system substrate-binding protein